MGYDARVRALKIRKSSLSPVHSTLAERTNTHLRVHRRVPCEREPTWALTPTHYRLSPSHGPTHRRAQGSFCASLGHVIIHTHGWEPESAGKPRATCAFLRSASKRSAVSGATCLTIRTCICIMALLASNLRTNRSIYLSVERHRPCGHICRESNPPACATILPPVPTSEYSTYLLFGVCNLLKQPLDRAGLQAYSLLQIGSSVQARSPCT